MNRQKFVKSRTVEGSVATTDTVSPGAIERTLLRTIISGSGQISPTASMAWSAALAMRTILPLLNGAKPRGAQIERSDPAGPGTAHKILRAAVRRQNTPQSMVTNTP